jgi:DNA-binding XRE family transcriptional regulator
MVTDEQVRRLRQKRMQGKTQAAAAASAGMSERTARAWERGSLPSEARQPRSWRTRSDPFAAVWASEIEPLLVRDAEGVLESAFLFEQLVERYPDRFAAGQVRTLQRRVREWRALHGPAREVFFPQVHPPGREAQIDFTHASELGVTIAGVSLDHLLFELVLSASGWRFAQIAFGETFEALVAGVQGALWALGGVMEVVRSDNLSAATHELRHSGGRVLTERFAAVLAHYGLRSTRIYPGASHENGVVEQAHERLKSVLAQVLVVRGSRDFPTLESYQTFVDTAVARLNKRRAERIAEELRHLRPLPPAPLPSYTVSRVVVRRWSTIRVSNRTYSVPSRLIGHEVEVRLHADVVEVLFAGRRVETMPRLRGDRDHRIDYRHVIWSLVRKPGAFARYRYREELFPTETFRRAYDALCAKRGERADVEYVRVLHLAASTLEATVERALAALLEAGEAFDYAAVRERAAPVRPEIPALPAPRDPDFGVYDALLTTGVGR